MTGSATVHVDLAKIAQNCRTLTSLLPSVDVVGVTKVTGGSPAVARALLAGGATELADSRLANIARMRADGVEATYWLLRAPSPQQAEEVVRLADVSLESELKTVRALSAAAARAGADHGVLCMVDVGDLREGVLPPDLLSFVEQCDALPGIHVEGVGVNLTCYGAIMPTCQNLGQVAELAAQAATALGRPLVVSGGNSGSLSLALRGELPAGITSLRIGESILLGLNTLTREPLFPELHLDAFLLTAPVVECLRKPSKPIGVCAQDMMGNVPDHEDRGTRRRAILALGRQDVVPELIRPLDPRAEVLGASSDHLILDVEDVRPAPRPGDEFAFLPGYGALLALFTSQYVDKDYYGAPGQPEGAPDRAGAPSDA